MQDGGRDSSSSVQQKAVAERNKAAEIIHGEPFTEQKSTFQVSWAASK